MWKTSSLNFDLRASIFKLRALEKRFEKRFYFTFSFTFAFYLREKCMSLICHTIERNSTRAMPVKSLLKYFFSGSLFGTGTPLVGYCLPLKINFHGTVCGSLNNLELLSVNFAAAARAAKCKKYPFRAKFRTKFLSKISDKISSKMWWWWNILWWKADCFYLQNGHHFRCRCETVFVRIIVTRFEGESFRWYQRFDR